LRLGLAQALQHAGHALAAARAGKARPGAADLGREARSGSCQNRRMQDGVGVQPQQFLALEAARQRG
jgi:hypothetical protein